MDIPVDTPSDAASSGRWTFVQEVENVHSSKTRRIVRSHAMTAVRKKQRSKEPDTLHSRWPEERLKRLPPKRHRRPETPSSGNDHKLLSMKNPRSPEEEHAFEHKPQPLYSDNLPWVIPGSEYPEEYNTFDQEELDPDIAEEFYESTDTKETRFYDGFPGSSWNATTSFSDPHHRGASQGTFQSGTGVRTILGAGRINPFQMLPVLPSRRIHELIDHYTTIHPSVFYGVRCRKPIHAELYALAVRDKASMHAMLAYASKGLDFLRCSEPSNDTTEHTFKAVQAVNKLLPTASTDCKDSVILSIGMLAWAELRFGRKEIAAQHWMGLHEVIRSRGGFSKMQCSHPLKATLAWVSIVWSLSRASSAPPSFYLPCLMAPEKTPCAIRQTCHNFVDFLSALNNSAFSHSVYRELNDEPKPVYTYGKSPRGYMKSPLFSPESPLYRLLHSDSTKSIGISDQRAAEACQIPCLIYINLTVLEYADRPYLADNFLCKLMNCVYEDNLDTSVSPEQLLMRLLLGIDGSESEKAERLYAMARLAFVAKRVGKNSEEKLRAALLMNLIMTDGPPREIPLITWDPRDLETEMLRD